MSVLQVIQSKARGIEKNRLKIMKIYAVLWERIFQKKGRLTGVLQCNWMTLEYVVKKYTPFSNGQIDFRNSSLRHYKVAFFDPVS